MRNRYSRDSVNTVLLQRGFVPKYAGDHGQLLLPAGLTEADWDLPVHQVSQLREMFGKESFRKVARRLTGAKDTPVPIPDLASMAGESVDKYLEFLSDLAVVQLDGGSVRFTGSADNIGPTLEWFVADLCETSLLGSAEWGVQLEGLPAGGDYDVLAWLSSTLVYIETKSSTPFAVEENELRQFLLRAADLAPDICVLLIDTADRRGLSDLVARLVQCSRFTVPGWPKLTPLPGSPLGIAELAPGLFFGSPRTFVTGSKPSILTQLRRCLQHYHTRVKVRTA